MNHIRSNLELFMLLGSGNAQRYNNVTQLYQVLGPRLSASLSGFHAFTEYDFIPLSIEEGKNLSTF